MEEIEPWDLFILLKLSGRFDNVGETTCYAYWIAPVGSAISFYRRYIEICSRHRIELNRHFKQELKNFLSKNNTYLEKFGAFIQDNKNPEATLSKLVFEVSITASQKKELNQVIEDYLLEFANDRIETRIGNLIKFDVQLDQLWKFIKHASLIWNNHYLEISEREWLNSLFKEHGVILTAPVRFLNLILILDKAKVIKLQKVQKYGSWIPEKNLGIADFWLVATIDGLSNISANIDTIMSMVRRVYPQKNPPVKSLSIIYSDNGDTVTLAKGKDKIRFDKKEGRKDSTTFKFISPFLSQVKNQESFSPVKLYSLTMEAYGKAFDKCNHKIIGQIQRDKDFINQKLKKVGLKLRWNNTESGDPKSHDSLILESS